MLKIPKLAKLRVTKWFKMAVSEAEKLPNLISRKIWMVEKSSNFHTAICESFSFEPLSHCIFVLSQSFCSCSNLGIEILDDSNSFCSSHRNCRRHNRLLRQNPHWNRYVKLLWLFLRLLKNYSWFFPRRNDLRGPLHGCHRLRRGKM